MEDKLLKDMSKAKIDVKSPENKIFELSGKSAKAILVRWFLTMPE